MADLLSLLSNASTALNAQQNVAAVASNNLANINTVGYSRETANLEAASLNVLGGVVLNGGTTVGSITQTRDRFVEAQLPGAMGSASFSQAQSESLSSVDALNTANASGLTSSMSAFWSALQALSQNTSDSSLRTAAVAAASQVARSFNTTTAALSAAQTGLDTQLAGSVTQVNSLANQMASLNQQIRVASSHGQQPNALLDARQTVQDQLVALTGATPVTDAQGDVSLALPSGDALVSQDGAATLSTFVDTANGGHLGVLMKRTDGTGPVTLPDASVGGQVGGWLSSRDGALATAQTSINKLATDFSTAVNSAHSAAYALDGSTGRALFTSNGTASQTAATLSVNSDIASDPTLLATKGTVIAGDGDSSGLATILSLQTTALSTGQDASDTLATITAKFGSSVSDATDMSTQDAAALNHLTTLRASASGVSSNEELVNMQRAQAAYQAMSKMISITQTMLDALMTIASK
jgi:flagellar hook-associated protein 1 FlgK